MTLALAVAAVAVLAGQPADPADRSLKTQRFDDDPRWDGHQNRIGAEREAVTVKQDFGYGRTAHAGGAAGEVGGRVTPAAEPAYYAKALPAARTLNDALSAAGTLRVTPGGGNTLVGFFNRDALNEWRTPNTIALRVNDRGDEGFHLHVEYCTARWRAGGAFFGETDPKTGKTVQRLIPSNVAHTWSLRYDPDANNGGGAVVATLDGEELVMNLDAGHKADGATFNRFGILNVLKSVDGPGELWLDDVSIDGAAAADSFDADPQWDGLNNRRTYETRNLRPWFDFGYSPTRHAGGAKPGEIGGLLFRGDERYPDRMAYYGDKLDELSLKDPLQASGKVCLRRGVTDSSVLFGFFHAEASMRHSETQKSGWPENFLGVAIEGPSSEGFFFYPAYSADEEGVGDNGARAAEPLRIYPDGAAHEWTLRYEPAGAEGVGRLTVTLDGRENAIDVPAEHARVGARFNRFGFVTTHIDGNGQEVYLDDLTYTATPRR